MRLKVTLQTDKAIAVPINHQHYLTAVVYRFLEQADADYAAFLHNVGYTSSSKDNPQSEIRNPQSKRFKLFVFAPLRCPRRRIEGDRLWLGPGAIDWLIASPVEKFLREFATGLLAQHTLQVGPTRLPIAQAETLEPPEFQTTMRFKCLSPIVAAVGEAAGDRRVTRYLLPQDPAFGECVRRNLLGKYAALHGQPPTDDRLTLTFDAAYLERHAGTKLVTYKDIQIRGAFAPFTVTGSVDLIRTGYDCGFGEKNAGGFGMAEVSGR